MRKTFGTLLSLTLVIAMVITAVPGFADGNRTYGQTMHFDEFDVVFESAKRSGDTITIKMNAVFPSKEIAEQYIFFSHRSDNDPAELLDNYQHFNKTMGKSQGVTFSAHDENGNDFFLGKGQTSLAFQANDPVKSSDGKWSCLVFFESHDIETDENDVAVGVSVYDIVKGGEFSPDPTQVMWVKIK